MTATLTTANAVTALSYDPFSNLLAVGNGGTIDFFRGLGKVKTYDTGGGEVNLLCLHHGRLAYFEANVGLKIVNQATEQIVLDVDVNNLNDICGISRQLDTNPEWPGRVSPSYETEPVPSGVYVGTHPDISQAILAGGTSGDWYRRKGTLDYYEIVTTEPPAEQQIYRAGSAKFPKNAIAVASPAEVVIFDTTKATPEMWMVFTRLANNMLNHATDVTSLAYSEGIVYTGGNDGSCRISFTEDVGDYVSIVDTRRYISDIAARNSTLGFNTTSAQTIVDNAVNDVASTVLSSVLTTNLLSDTDNPSTQSVTTLASTYTLGFDGSGSVVLSGTATDTLDGSTFPQQVRQWLTFDATAGSLTLTLSGDVRNIQLEESSAPHEYVPSVTGPTTGSTPPAKQLINRTNLLTHSADITQATWNKSNGAVALDATTCSFPAAADARLVQAVSAEGLHTFSAYLAGPEGGEEVIVELVDNGAIVDSLPVTLTTQLTRYTVSGDLTTGTRQVRVSNGVSAVAKTFTATDFQLESGTQSTPYINTTDSPATVTDDTGLFIPDWAVATDGGVSNGRDDGNVWDITGYSQFVSFVDFTSRGELLTNYNFVVWGGVYAPLTADIDTSAYLRRYFNTAETANDLGAPRFLSDANGGLTDLIALDGDYISGSTVEGLTVICEDIDTYTEGAYTHVTATYNTGPMVQPDGAWANDSDTAPIGFPWDLYEDFNAANILRFEDTFNRTDPAPWFDAGGTGIVSIEAGKLVQTNTSGSVTLVRSQITDPVPFIAGNWYKLSAVWSGTNNGRLRVLDGGAVAFQSDSVASGLVSVTFQAALTSYNIQVQANSLSDGEAGIWDDVIIEEVPALEGWLAVEPTGIYSIVNGALRLENGAAAAAKITKQFPVQPNTDYVVGLDNAEDLDGVIRVGASAGSSELLFEFGPRVPANTAGLRYSFNSGANAAVYLTVDVNSTAQGAYAAYDSITVQEALLDNSTFDTDLSGWTFAPEWSWSNGTASCNYAGGAGSKTLTQTQGTPVIAGRAYYYEYSIINYVSGAVRFNMAPSGQTEQEGASGDGVQRGSFIATSVTPQNAELLTFDAVGFVGDIEYLILTEALPDNSGQGNDGQAIGQILRKSICESLGSFDSGFDQGFD